MADMMYSEEKAAMREMCRRLELADEYLAALEKRLRVAIGCWRQLETLRCYIEKSEKSDDIPNESLAENSSKQQQNYEDTLVNRENATDKKTESLLCKGNENDVDEKATEGNSGKYSMIENVTDFPEPAEKVEGRTKPEESSTEWSNYLRHVTSLSKTVVEIGYDLIKAAQFIPQLQEEEFVLKSELESGVCYCDVMHDLSLRMDRLNRWHDDLVHVEMIRIIQYVSSDVIKQNYPASEVTSVTSTDIDVTLPLSKDVKA